MATRRIAMATHDVRASLQLRSLVRGNGELELSFASVPVPWLRRPSPPS
jgi:hypothetical protein